MYEARREPAAVVRGVGIAGPLAVLTAVSLTLLLWLATPAHAGFAPQTTYPVGKEPTSIAVGDFNADADPDLATTSVATDSVSVRLGGPGGSFAAKTSFPTGDIPYSVAVGDFNGDADPDLATADEASSTVSVLLGEAGGGFGPPTSFPVRATPVSVAAGDFNGDADPDLAVVNGNGNLDGHSTVSVLLGGPGGSFGPAATHRVGTFAIAVAVGDFNGDFDLDLAVTETGPSVVSVLLGGAGGDFGPRTTFPVQPTPVSVAVGEFNGDADPDLATANESASVSVLLGGEGGSFGSATSFNFGLGNWSSSVAVGDFSGDGDPDLAISHHSDIVSVLRGGAGGTFGAQTVYPAGDGPAWLAIGDFNGDANPDLAVANRISSTVSVLLNNGLWQVALDPGNVRFAPTPAGSASAPEAVTLTNEGPTDLSVNDVALAGADASGFATSDDSCSGATVAPGGTCSVAVRFRPLRVGQHSARLQFTDNAPGSPHSVALSGTATAPVTVSPSSVAFQPAPDSTTTGRRTVTLTNRSGADLTVDRVGIGGADASSFLLPATYDQCTGTILPDGQGCEVKVRFRPDGVGPKTARLNFADDAITSPQRVPLSGTGTAGPWLTTTPQALKFGNVPLGTTTATRTVTLTNTGSAAMNISEITLEGTNPGDFVGLSETCTALGSLGPDESCSAQIAFRPTATGSRTATLTIDDTAPGSPHRVHLYGTGV
jgi:hypothetical protein